MAGPLIECVPNFSEGRDLGIVQTIEQAIRSVADVRLLGWEMDPDHNRSVMTFAGSPDAVMEGALRGIAAAVARIDLHQHTGVHPRIGAADVVPFVPLTGSTIEQCAELAHRTGRLIWERLGVPVYFYEHAALSPERVALENIRRGGFENPVLAPDLGGPGLHPTAGASAIGARRLLVAFNVNLQSTDLEIAKSIAWKIRASSGGLPFVKAMGGPLASRKLVQVSMNLTDFERTPLYKVYDAVSAEAAALGVAIAGTQIVGFAPREALQGFNGYVESGKILENALGVGGTR